MITAQNNNMYNNNDNNANNSTINNSKVFGVNYSDVAAPSDSAPQVSNSLSVLGHFKQMEGIKATSGPLVNDVANVYDNQVQVQARDSTIQTRKIADSMIDDLVISKHHLPDSFRMSLSPWLNRPFYVGTVTWDSTAARFSLITSPIVNLPRDVFNANGSLASILRAAALFRSKLCLSISITGTISHQGMILASVTPPTVSGTGYWTSGGRSINTMLSGPHGFLSANEASSICIEVPWYYNYDFAVLDSMPNGSTKVCPDIVIPNSDCATLNFMVLNPLVPSTGASTSVSIVIEAMFKELDLYVPLPKLMSFMTVVPTSMEGEMFRVAQEATDSLFALGKKTAGDAIDAMRNSLRKYTGLHNPNDATLDTKHVVTPRNYLNTVDSSTYIEKLDPYSTFDRVYHEPVFNTEKDEMLIKHIVSKPQYLGSFQVSSSNHAGALLWTRPISPYQGGSSAAHYISNNIEAMYYMTRAWKGGLKLHIQSAMSNRHSVKLKVVKLYAPSATVASSYPTLSSAAAGAPTDLLEFSGGNQILEVKLPFLCRNRLSYCSRDNAYNSVFVGQYYIYLAQPLVYAESAPTTVEFNIYMSCDEDCQFYGYSRDFAAVSYFGESATVMNLPSGQESLLSSSSKDSLIDDSRLVPLVDVRPLIRRYQIADILELPVLVQPIGSLSYDLTDIICESFDGYYRGSNGIVPAMFYGKSPGLKFKVKCTPSALTNISYIPPNAYADNGPTQGLRRTRQNTNNAGWYSDFEPTSTTTDPRGVFPVPGVEFPVTWILNTDSSVVSEYEFEIPFVSISKFIGGPEKFTPAPTVPATTITSPAADFGYLRFSYHVASTEETPPTLTIYYAFTDETRFGFQAIAPILKMPTVTTTALSFLSTDGTPGNLFATALPASLYYSNLTTTYS